MRLHGFFADAENNAYLPTAFALGCPGQNLNFARGEVDGIIQRLVQAKADDFFMCLCGHKMYFMPVC